MVSIRSHSQSTMDTMSKKLNPLTKDPSVAIHDIAIFETLGGSPDVKAKSEDIGLAKPSPFEFPS